MKGSDSPTHQIVANIGARNLTDCLTLVLHQNNESRKIVKIIFRPATADFYIALNYLKVHEYVCGTMTGVYGQETTTRTDENVNTSRLPVKLSYHESGQAHIREQRQDAAPVLVKSQCVPIRELSGEHLFSLEFEGIDSFARAKPREIQRESTVAIALPEPAARARVVGYAGYSYGALCGKYEGAPQGGYPSFVVQFNRPGLPSPLLLGLYLFTAPTLQIDGPPKPMQLAVFGFERGEESAKGLFVRAFGAEGGV